MTVLIHLFVVLILARLVGEALFRMGQPSSVGEILAGACMAAAIAVFGADLPYLAAFAESPVLQYSAEAGIFSLILLAGIEMRPKELTERSASSFLVALGGVILPFLGGFAVGWLFLPKGPDFMAQAFLIGVALSITALPVSIRVLEELGIAHGTVAHTILAAAVFDDILGLVLTAVMIAMIETGEAPSFLDIALLLGKVTVFFLIAVLIGQHIYPAIRRGVELMQAMSVELSALVLGALAYGALAEFLGLHWILGPFVAGMFFEPARVGKKVYKEVRLAVLSIVSGIMGPIFFFTIGLGLEFDALVSVPYMVAALIVVAFLGKILGAGVPAYLTGLPKHEATAVGIGMCSRGAVVLVVLSIAAEAGLMDGAQDNGDPAVRYLYSAIVITAVVTTLMTPLLLRRTMKGHIRERKRG